MSLKQKAIKGVSWNLIDRFGRQGIKFILNIILARLLTPEAFGLVGMITVFFAVAQVFIESGFGQAYIQKKEATHIDANTVFFTNLFLSLALYGILWLSAPLIARFYEEPKLIDLIHVMGLVIIINAFNVIQVAKLSRAINFKSMAKVNLVSTIFAGTSGITAAYYGLGVWSLVIQSLTNRSLSTAGLWFLTKWKPSLQISKDSFKEMFSFGSWVLFASIIRKIFDNIYILVIGKVFTTGDLGLYTKSKQFKVLASEQISKAIGLVAFPIFSKLQSNNDTLRKGMKSFLQQSFLFMIPLLTILIVVAKPFVILLLTEKWAPMIPFLQLFCILGILFPIRFLNVQVLKAKGKSNVVFKLEMIRNVMRVLNIILMYRWGISYIIIGEITLTFITIIITTFFIHKLINYGFSKQLKDTKEIIFGAIISGTIGFFSDLYIINLWHSLIFVSLIILAIYILTQYFLNKFVLIKALENIKITRKS